MRGAWWVRGRGECRGPGHCLIAQFQSDHDPDRHGRGTGQHHGSGGVAFTVNSVGASTASSSVSVSATGVVLATATKELKVSLQANAASFTPPSGSATWNASDVTWNVATWTNATAASGTLSNSAFNTVASTADVASCSTSGLVFTLAANTNIVRSGNYTLVVTWKFESIGT